MAFDVEGARQAGYSDAEIAQHLKSKGLAPAEITSTLAPAAAPAAPQRSASEAAEAPLPGRSAPASSPPPAYVDPEGLGRPEINPLDTPPPGVVSRVGQAFTEGWQGAPDTGPVRDAVTRNLGISAPLINPLIAAAGGALGGASGAYRGMQQAGVEMISPLLGPQAARDIVSIPDAFVGSPHMTSVPGRPPIPGTEMRVPVTGQRVPIMHAAPEAPPAPSPRFVGEYYGESTPGSPPVIRLEQVTQAVRDAPGGAPEKWRPVAPGEEPQPGRQYRMNQTTGQREVNEGGSGAVQRGVPEPEAGAPQPAGAQVTPATEAGLTPEQAAEYGSVADKQWLYKSFRPGEPITEEFVRGITPTMAQREQTVARARETKDLRNLSPEAAQAERELLDEHNTKRKAEFQEIAGSDVTQGNDIRAANEAIDKELEAAHSHGGRVDSQPTIQAITAERNAPSGKLPPVETALDVVEKALNKRDGTGLETDPRQVHGARRVITYLLSKRGQAEHPAYGDPDVQAALIRVRDVIDGTIEPASPGFKQALTNFSEAQRKIEAREIMQEAEKTLYDDQGRMQFRPFHAFMRKAVNARDPEAPLSPYKSLNEEQWNRLKGLHDNLMQVASAEDLAKAFGSDTAQNAAGFMRRALRGAASTIAGSVVGTGVTAVTGPVTGTIAGGTTAAGVQRLFTRREQARAVQDMNKMLRPDPALYPTRPNPFMGPGPGP